MSRVRRGLASAAAVCVSAALCGCADMLLPADPANGPEETARALWQEVDQYYPAFDVKQVDWDAVGAEYLPRVRAETSPRDLLAILGAMVGTLRDGHMALESPVGWSAYDGWYKDHPPNYDPGIAQRYLSQPAGFTLGGTVSWGTLAPGIGYLRIGSFGRDGTGDAVDLALSGLGALSGLVVDVRSNGGGSDIQSEAAAARFAAEPVVYRIVRYKAGPAHDDFGPEMRTLLRPAGSQRFTGPVVVLQNRGVFSAAEDFILAMRVLPNVTFVGDTTGGGAGNPIARELPNGWVAHVPRWRTWAADGTSYEGVGLGPHKFVSMDPATGRDAIIERAIERLRTVRPSPPEGGSPPA